MWSTGSEAHGILLDQRSNLCLLYWQTDSLPLSHQESPVFFFLTHKKHIIYSLLLLFKNFNYFLWVSFHVRAHKTLPLVFGHYSIGVPNLGLNSKESACNAGDPRFNPWVGKIPWRRQWQPTPVLLPGESHGQRSLVGYSSP